MASIRKRGNNYQVTVSNGRDITGRQLLETATFRPDPSNVLPSLGHLKLSRIQPTHLNKLYNAMLKERRDGRPGGYSPATVKRVHALISSIMGTAVKWNVVLDNPCERVSPPKQVRNMDDIKFFTLEQCSAFLAAVDTDLAAGRIKSSISKRNC